MAIDIVAIQSYLCVYTAEARAGLLFRGRDTSADTLLDYGKTPRSTLVSSTEP